MSSTIIYDKQFIKLPNKQFIAMTLAGSSNCTEIGPSGRERRDRSWYPLTYILKGKVFGTLEEMVAGADAELARRVDRGSNWDNKTPKEIADNFGYHTSLRIGSGRNTTFGMYKGLFVTGVKKALTVEQLAEFYVRVTVSSYAYDEEKVVAKGFEPYRIVVKTGEELIQLIEEKQALEAAGGFSMVLSIDANERDMKRIRREHFPTTQKVRQVVTVDKFWVLACGYGYFVKNLKYGFSYSGYETGAKAFRTEKAAQAFLSKAHKAKGETWSVVEINKPTSIVIRAAKKDLVEN